MFEFCIIGIYINPANYTHTRARARAYAHTEFNFHDDYLCIVLLMAFSKKEANNRYLLKQLQKQN